jgi:hypothetical protein
MCDQVFHIPLLLEALLAALGILGGCMAAGSGLRATLAYWNGQTFAVIADRVNLGLIQGFTFSAPLTVVTYIIIFIR